MLFPGEPGDRFVARLHPDGSRDVSFPAVAGGYLSGGGKLTQWEDRYYVATNSLVRRFWPNGDIDYGYGNSTGSVPYFSPSQGGDYHVFPDGRVVMSGNHYFSDTIRGFVGMHNFIWFTNTGYLDTTRTHRKGNGAIYNFKELSDGKFICNGTLSEFEGEPIDKIFRLNADGSRDMTFQTGAYWGVAGAYHELADGRILMGGLFLINGISDTLRLARLLPNGTVDPTFNLPSFSLGIMPDATGFGSLVSNIYPLGQDYYILQGNFREVNGQHRLGICMINENGDLVESVFHDHGGGPTQYMGNTFANQQGIAPTPDGEYFYVWGRYHGYSDGTVNDTLQRFITRLHAGDLALAIEHSPPNARPFSIQPNPATDQVTFTFDHATGSSIMIRDLAGRSIASLDVRAHSDRITWNTARLAPGIYVAALVTDGSVIASQKLVVE